MKGTRFYLNGKVAMVTGGSKGLGKVMAQGFTRAGWEVAICSSSESNLRVALEEITDKTEIRGHYFVTDMSQRQQVKELVKSVLDAMGRVDILVNNADSNIPQGIDEIVDEDLDQIIELNLDSCMVLKRALVP